MLLLLSLLLVLWPFLGTLNKGGLGVCSFLSLLVGCYAVSERLVVSDTSLAGLCIATRVLLWLVFELVLNFFVALVVLCGTEGRVVLLFEVLGVRVPFLDSALPTVGSLRRVEVVHAALKVPNRCGRSRCSFVFRLAS